jgi:hypothetical protein
MTQGFAAPANVITKDTQKITFQDGRLVVVDGKRVGSTGGKTGDKRIAFAVYSDPEKITGNMHFWATLVPESLFVCHVLGVTDVYPRDPNTEMIVKQKEQNYFKEIEGVISSVKPEERTEELTHKLMLEYALKKTRDYFWQLEGNQEIISKLLEAIEHWAPFVLQEKQEMKISAGFKADFCPLQLDKIRFEGFGVRGECYFFSNQDTMKDKFFLGYTRPEGHPIHSNWTAEIYKRYK